MTHNGSRQAVLVVDDDEYARSYFCSSLKLMQYKVVTAACIDEARRIVDREGVERFACVLTDFRMPYRAGLLFLSWIRRKDANLATILVTAEGEKDLVTASLREGVIDYLEKPIHHSALEDAVRRAVEHTRAEREREASHRGLREALRSTRLFREVLAPQMQSRLEMRHFPAHEVGGDFCSVSTLSPGRNLVLLGDVSGHDVKAAFISAYFQGMMRGLLECRNAIGEMVGRFNRILCEEWNRVADPSRITIPVSLAVCVCELDFEQEALKILCCGGPGVSLIGRDGGVRVIHTAHPPLGWYADERFEPARIPFEGITDLLLHTDGVEALAAEQKVLKNAVIHRFLSTRESELTEIEQHPPDDLLIMRIKVDTEVATDDQWHPIINEQYSGDEVRDIDKAQNIWRRSLRYAIEAELGDRLYDVLTCIREAMLNAFVHGCGEESDRLCSLQVNYHPGDRTLRIRVDDSGPGHKFDPKKRLKELDGSQGNRLGLSLIQAMSDRCRIENEGTSITFEFKLQ